MLKKSLRLGRKDIKRFFKSKSFAWRGKILSARARRPGKAARSRFAFAVSGPKRSAVKRNTARRRMAEAIRQIYGEIPKGWEIIFFLKLAERRSPSYAALKKDINDILSENIF